MSDPLKPKSAAEVLLGRHGGTDSSVPPKPPEEETRADRAEVAARAVPAVFADTYYTSMTESLTRIAFGEEVSDDAQIPHYRAAFIMPTRDALGLARTILSLWTDVEKEKAEEKKSG